MWLIDGDLLSVDEGVIVHQVNASGKMAAGLALAIRNKYPKVYQDYQRHFRNDTLTLGRVLYTQVGASLWVASIVAQQFYGRTGQYTDYGALERCLRSVAAFAKTRSAPVSLPFHLGAGLAGGDWDTIAEIIERTLPDAYLIRKN